MTVGEYHEAMKAEGSEPDVSEFDGGYYKSLRRAIPIYSSPTACKLRGYGRAAGDRCRGECHEAMKAEGSEPDVSEFDGGYYKSLRRAITIYSSPTECPLRGPCMRASALYRLYIGIADGVPIARVWACGHSPDRLAQALILSSGTSMSVQWKAVILSTGTTMSAQLTCRR